MSADHLPSPWPPGQIRIPTANSEPHSRREFVRTGLGVALALAGMGAGCTTVQRRFIVKNVFDLHPRDLLTEVAFYVTENTLEFLDAECKHCNKILHVGKHLWSAAVVLSIPCPECGLTVRVGTAGLKVVFDILRDEGFKRAVAYARNGHYEVYPESVGTSRSANGLYVAESVICDAIEVRVPVGRYGSSLGGVPSRLVFFTDVRGLSTPTRIMHVWRRNGVVTDRIPLKICYGECGTRFRTWSRKRNLAPGAWIVTAETRDGEVLAVKNIYLD